MDTIAWRAIAALMEPGESPVWTGRPNPARLARAAAGRSVLAVAFLVLCVYLLRPQLGRLLDGAINWASPWPLAAAAIGAIGLKVALGPVFAYLRATRTYYAATNRRVLRVCGKRVDWAPIGGLAEPEVRLRADGTGDVFLRMSVAAFTRPRGARDLAFLGVRNPDEVRQYVLNAIRTGRVAGSTAPSGAPVPPAVSAANATASAREAWPALLRSRSAGAILALCVSSLFFDVLGYVFGLAGLFLLWKRRVLKLRPRLALTVLVLLPRIAVIWFYLGSGQAAYQLQTRTFASSPSVWAWSLLVCGLGIGCFVLANAFRRGAAFAAVEQVLSGTAANREPARRWPAAAICGFFGVVLTAASALMFLGLEDDFQAIEPGAGGEWRLTHLVRGTVATFLPAEVQSIGAERRRSKGSGSGSNPYRIRVKLHDGREWSMDTRSPAAPEERLKKLAGTMDLPPGTMRLRFTPGREWVNSGRKLRPEDWVGSYRMAGADAVLEFRVVEGRLAGTEILQLGDERMARELRNIQVSPGGEIEFTTEVLAGARKQGESRYSFSFGYQPHRRAVLHDGFVEVDGARYDLVASTTR